MKRFFLLTIVFSIFFVLAACGEEATNANGSNKKPKELIIALDQTDKDSWVRASQKFSELVKEKTDGSINITVHHSGTLGSQKEILEGMLTGTMHGTLSLEPLTYWVEDINLFGIPYLFEDEDHLKRFIESEHGKELEEKLIAKGFRPLTYFNRPPRQITSNKPINSLSDVKGLSIRVPETATGPAAFKALGAAPVALAFSELYNALESGVIDAQENPITTIYSNNLHEVQSHFAYTNHQYQIGYYLLSEKTYQSLTDDERAAIDEAAKETQVYEAKILAEDMETIKKSMEEEGIVFTEPNVQEFADAAHAAYGGYDELMKEWIKKVEEVK